MSAAIANLESVHDTYTWEVSEEESAKSLVDLYRLLLSKLTLYARKSQLKDVHFLILKSIKNNELRLSLMIETDAVTYNLYFENFCNESAELVKNCLNISQLIYITDEPDKLHIAAGENVIGDNRIHMTELEANLVNALRSTASGLTTNLQFNGHDNIQLKTCKSNKLCQTETGENVTDIYRVRCVNELSLKTIIQPANKRPVELKYVQRLEKMLTHAQYAGLQVLVSWEPITAWENGEKVVKGGLVINVEECPQKRLILK